MISIQYTRLGILVIGNIFKDLLQQCDVSKKCKLLSFTAEKTVFKNNVSLKNCLAADGSIYAQRTMFFASYHFYICQDMNNLTCFAHIGLF